MKCEISVVIPAYNCEKYIERCIESLLNQKTNINYEIIIIDDGSKDKTEKICQKIIKKNSRRNISFYKKNNSGVASARNFGIRKAKGKWITFVDSDDFVSEEYLSELYYNKENSDFVIANHINYYANGQEKNNIFTTPQKDIQTKCIINLLDENLAKKKEKIEMKSIRTVWGKLYNLNIIKDNKVEFPEGIRLFEDGIFNLQYLIISKNITFVDKSIYYYVQNQNSETKKYQSNLLLEDINKLEILNKIIYENKDFKSIDFAYELFKFNLFTDYLERDLYNISNEKNSAEKIEQLKIIKEKRIYCKFNIKLFSYLSSKKKIVLLLMIFNMFHILNFVLNIRNIGKEKK